ncbi:hypothetical protein KVV02_008470 [Mortierella alpina]|uniref:Uncharacterized protein n=1 Tax=Mortierella alpina TaxID=64518 RepID=A0A9P8CXX2_MORAP|nr:hypothetical protein KVV02_008470 [Mortierella alpina]
MVAGNSNTVIHCKTAPKALGPYSHAIVTAGNLVFCSGQTPLNPTTGEVIEGGIREQTRQSLINLQSVLESANSSLGHLVKTTVFLKDMNDFEAMNQVYGEMVQQKEGGYVPARSTVEVARLPKDVKVEIECVAAVRS